MSHQKKHKNIMESLLIPLDDGQQKIKLNLQERKVIIEDITLQVIKKKEEKILSMQEYHLKNNNLNYKTKLPFLHKNIQNSKLLQISDQELTLNDLDLEKFWSNYLTEISNKLWLPQKTDLHDFRSNCLNLSLNGFVPNSSLSILKNINSLNKNCQKICYQSLQFSPADTMEGEIITSKKLRIYPSSTQKKFFEKCFGVTRHVYNNVVNFVNNSKTKTYEKYKIKKCKNKKCDQNYFCKEHKHLNKIKYEFKNSLPFLRKNTMINDKDLKPDNFWLKEIPYDTRQLSIKDFVMAHKAAITNFRNKNIKKFQMNFKSKKNLNQMFNIDKRAIDIKLNLFKRRKTGKLRIRNKTKKWIKENMKSIDCNCKIQKMYPNKYYLIVSQKKQKQKQNQKHNVVSLDPGMRTFQTFYSPDGIVGKLGHNFADEKLLPLGKRIDNLTSIRSKCKKYKTRSNLRKRMALLRTKIKNITSNLHWKTIKFLCDNFKTILLPTFETKKMSHKIKRCITSKTTRMLLSLSHYKFKQKLLYMGSKRGNRVIIVNEAFTTKTCGKCGEINQNIGGKKIFKCNKCGICVDRDINGARNILLRLIR